MALSDDIKTLEDLYSKIKNESLSLSKEAESIESISDVHKQAKAFATTGTSALMSLRSYVDKAELLVADEYWAIPRYDQLLAAI